MASKQLILVARFEKEKEQKAAQLYQMAQQQVAQQRQKLSSLQQYRLDYLRQIQLNAKGGVGAKAYHQHLTFVGQLEKACQQQLNVISKATLAADQRKRAWLEQQKRRKAVDLLLEKKAQDATAKANRAEQAMMDEFAMQRHFRAHHAK
ncbi:flagellar export protein FliJ [Aestuariibacter sp. A3R04]|uniref:flagellar export protein FliJ n=1 Tax=Aestuariibacter sp. A3R04 TaxID=2841571 RepID=UPI001C091135|nr:flagellar export protein FliJ [Aestuariibacter sp. A3R04]MBU3022211.1 flagellar export protein FliJ [Aestuariibacter sp. A3R04]